MARFRRLPLAVQKKMDEKYGTKKTVNPMDRGADDRKLGCFASHTFIGSGARAKGFPARG